MYDAIPIYQLPNSSKFHFQKLVIVIWEWRGEKIKREEYYWDTLSTQIECVDTQRLYFARASFFASYSARACMQTLNKRHEECNLIVTSSHILSEDLSTTPQIKNRKVKAKFTTRVTQQLCLSTIWRPTKLMVLRWVVKLL